MCEAKVLVVAIATELVSLSPSHVSTAAFLTHPINLFLLPYFLINCLLSVGNSPKQRDVANANAKGHNQ